MILICNNPSHPIQWRTSPLCTFLVQTFHQGFVHDLVLLEKSLQPIRIRAVSFRSDLLRETAWIRFHFLPCFDCLNQIFRMLNPCQQHTVRNCPSIRDNDPCKSAFTSGSMGGSLSLHVAFSHLSREAHRGRKRGLRMNHTRDTSSPGCV